MRYIFFYTKFIFKILIMIWVVGLILFINQIPRNHGAVPQDCDAIIVLTGGSNRIEAGIKILSGNNKLKLLITGVGENASLDDLSRVSKDIDIENIKHLIPNITLGYKAQSTLENVMEAKEWLEKNYFKEFILITSNYHMPRSLAEFQAALRDAKIYPYPVFSEAVKVNEWWLFSGTFALIISEYNKYLIFLLSGIF